MSVNATVTPVFALVILGWNIAASLAIRALARPSDERFFFTSTVPVALNVLVLFVLISHLLSGSGGLRLGFAMIGVVTAIWYGCAVGRLRGRETLGAVPAVAGALLVILAILG
jgi:hypothetical protein